MAHLGDITLGDTIDFKFSTVGTTGAPTTLAGSPVVSAYVGNSTTQLTAGITLSVDFDGVTGLHSVRVVASGANGYAAQTNVDLVITTGTVGGTSVVGYVIGSFSIENRSTQLLATAAALAVVDGVVDSILVDTAEIGVAGAGLTALATQASVNTIDDFLDTEVAAIKAKTDSLTFTVAGQVDANALAISGSTAAADNLEESTEVIGTGTCTTGGSTTSVVASAVSPASAVNDQFNGRVMIFKGNTTAALAGQATTISDYDHASLTFTVVALTTAPASGDLFTIL